MVHVLIQKNSSQKQATISTRSCLIFHTCTNQTFQEAEAKECDFLHVPPLGSGTKLRRKQLLMSLCTSPWTGINVCSEFAFFLANVLVANLSTMGQVPKYLSHSSGSMSIQVNPPQKQHVLKISSIDTLTHTSSILLWYCNHNF